MSKEPSTDERLLAEALDTTPWNHNNGQPLRKQLNQYGHQHTKYHTECVVEQRESLACIQENYHNKSACQAYFDRYRACSREENKRRLAENAKKGFWN
jgi:hypothetical protein